MEEYAHVADSGVYTARHFTSGLGYPQALKDLALDSKGLLTGELAAENCPRALRLVFEYATYGDPFHTVSPRGRPMPWLLRRVPVRRMPIEGHPMRLTWPDGPRNARTGTISGR